MTTVACDGHWMAADGLVTTAGDIICEMKATKVARLKDNSIIGMSGTVGALEGLRAFLEGEKPEAEICGTWDALRLMPDGSGLYYCDKHPTMGVASDWPATLGTGGELALGAMLAGATPKRAVEIAVQRDVWSGGQIIVLCRRAKD